MVIYYYRNKNNYLVYNNYNESKIVFGFYLIINGT